MKTGSETEKMTCRKEVGRKRETKSDRWAEGDRNQWLQEGEKVREEKAGRCVKPAQVVTTDCEDGLREGQNRENQRMRDERGLSLCNLLHCDGMYLPTLHQQYPPCACVCTICVAWRRVLCAFSSMLALCSISVKNLSHKTYCTASEFGVITFPVNQTQIKFLFCITAAYVWIKGWAFVILVTYPEMPGDSSDVSNVCHSNGKCQEYQFRHHQHMCLIDFWSCFYMCMCVFVTACVYI